MTTPTRLTDRKRPASVAAAIERSPQFKDGKFRNVATMRKLRFADNVDLFWKFMFHKPKGTVPTGTIPVHALSREQLPLPPPRGQWKRRPFVGWS